MADHWKANAVSACLGAVLAILATRLLTQRSQTEHERAKAPQPVQTQLPNRPAPISITRSNTEPSPRMQEKSNTEPSSRMQEKERRPSIAKKPSMVKRETCGAGDSDSDEESSAPKIPRELLSPVPRDQLTSIVVFGADGNLAKKKLLPTLYLLWRRRLLPRDCLVFGFARPKGGGGSLDDTISFRQWLIEVLKPTRRRDSHEEENDENTTASYTVGEFVTRCHFSSGQFGDQLSTEKLLALIIAEERKRLNARGAGQRWLQRVRESVHGDGAAAADVPSMALSLRDDSSASAARMYYLSVPPFLYAQICSALCTARSKPQYSAPAGLQEQFILEKPFGRDDVTCGELMGKLSMLRAHETFYIDHYLGKELVMNLLVLRFANVCFGAIWNRQHIKSVQVIFKEKIGAEGRAGYFDQYGIVRDVMQNHLLQMVALVAMEQPLNLTAEHIRQEKLKVLNACRPVRLDDLVTGQYEGYRDDDGIDDKATRTETFAAAVLHVRNPRWDGVPFVLKAGKALNDSKVELRVQFHAVPGVVSDLEQCVANELVVVVQPEPAIYWKVQNKVPGLRFEVEQVRMDLLYSKSYILEQMPEAYERLLLEALVNDHSHFVSAEELAAQWRIFTPVLKELVARKVEPAQYAYGSRGPAAADKLARRYGMTKFGGGLTPYVFVGDLLAGNTVDEHLNGGGPPTASRHSSHRVEPS